MVAACGGGESSGTTPSDATTRTTDYGDGSSFDVATVEELIDAHDQAWLDNDPEGVGAFFTDEGVFVDLIGPTVGREEIVRYAEIHVELIPESQRTGPVEIRGDGTFVYPGYLVVTGVGEGDPRGGTYKGVVSVTVEDGLFARYDLSQLTKTEDS